MIKRIQDTIQHLWPGDEAAASTCATRPGRCLRGRWGSLYTVLIVIIKNLPFLPQIFWHLFGVMVTTVVLRGMWSAEPNGSLLMNSVFVFFC